MSLQHAGGTAMKIIPHCFVLGLLFLPPVFAVSQTTSSDILLTFTDALNDTSVIHFGYKPGATYCIDAALGEDALAPIPPYGFDVRFVDSRTGPGACLEEGLVLNYHDPATPVDTFAILLTAPSRFPLTLSWPHPVSGIQSMRLTDRPAGERIGLDMLADSSVLITDSTISRLWIIVQRPDESVRPEASTGAADSITTYGARLNGEVNPHGFGTHAWFQWGTRSGVYSNQTQGITVGSGTTIVSFSRVIYSGIPGEMIYYRLVADNAMGVAYGNESTFRTLFVGLPPVITTLGATDITDSTATLVCRLGARDEIARVYFEWGEAISYDSAVGLLVINPSLNDSILTFGVGRLLPYSLYHFRARATTAGGETAGRDTTFIVKGNDIYPTIPLTVATTGASRRVGFGYKPGATNCIDPWLGEDELPPPPPTGLDVRFQTRCLGTAVALNYHAPGAPLDTFFLQVASDDQPLIAMSWPSGIKGVSSMILREYRSDSVVSIDMLSATTASFDISEYPLFRIIVYLNDTISRPAVSTYPADSLTINGGRLVARLNPHSMPTDAWFEWGFTSGVLSNTTPHQAVGNGKDTLVVTATITGLAANQKIFYRAVAQNVLGISDGEEYSFITLPSGHAPEGALVPVDLIGQSSARIRGSVNTYGSPATVTFEWGPTTDYLTGTSVISLGGADTVQPVSFIMDNLQNYMRYHARLRVSTYGGAWTSPDAWFQTSGDPLAPSIPIHVTSTGGWDYILTFGNKAGATRCLDASLGEVELPPLPPSGLDARFIESRPSLPACLGSGVHVNYHNIPVVSDTFEVSVWQDLTVPVTVTWPGGLLGLASCVLKNLTDTLSPPVDMLTDSLYSFPGGGTTRFIIVVSPAPLAQSMISFRDGWNLVSIPSQPVSNKIDDLFPMMGSKGFIFNGRYQPVDWFENGQGFWLKHHGVENILVNGAQVGIRQIPLKVGWNIIGTVSRSVPVASVVSDPPNIVISHVYGYNGTYYTATELQPGNGYWIKASQEGRLILDISAAGQGNLGKSGEGGELPPPPPDEITSVRSSVPLDYALSQSMPNPANPVAVITYALPAESRVELTVYNILGEKVGLLADGVKQAGTYTAIFDGSRLASGLYFYSLRAGKFEQTRKVLLIK
jgi:hypothetical protein